MAIQLIDTVTPDIGLKTVADKINANFTDANNAAAADVVGTVSQTGGVSDGAIIERGSNASGEYVKFADGTMITHQVRSIDLSDIATTSITSKWAAAGDSLPATFAVVFNAFFGMELDLYNATAIHVLTTTSAASGIATSACYSDPSATYTNSAVVRDFSVTTIGKWI